MSIESQISQMLDEFAALCEEWKEVFAPSSLLDFLTENQASLVKANSMTVGQASGGPPTVVQEGTSVFGDDQCWKVSRNGAQWPRAIKSGMTLQNGDMVAYAIVKKITGVFELLVFGASAVAYASFNMDTGTATATTGNAAKMTQIDATDWWLCEVTWTAVAGGAANRLIPGVYDAGTGSEEFYVSHTGVLTGTDAVAALELI